eukprot:gene23360-30619_t
MVDNQLHVSYSRIKIYMFRAKSLEPLYTVDNCAQLYLFSDYSSMLSTQIKVVTKSGAKAKAAPKKTALEKTRGTIKNPGTWQEGDRWQPGDSDRFVYITENNLQMMRSGPCFHCRSTNAPAWRRNLDELCCNKCGLKGRRRALKVLNEAVYATPMVVPLAAGVAASSGDSPANSADGYSPTHRHDGMGSSHSDMMTDEDLAGQGFFSFDYSCLDEYEDLFSMLNIPSMPAWDDPLVTDADACAGAEHSVAAVVAGANESAQPFTSAGTNAVYGGSGISDGVEEMNREPKNSSDEGCWGGADSMKFLMSQLAELPLEFIDTDSPVDFTCFDHV